MSRKRRRLRRREGNVDGGKKTTEQGRKPLEGIRDVSERSRRREKEEAE